MNLSIQGKKALVCGSSQGIGLAAAQELALLGADITLLARNEASLNAALATLGGVGTHQIAVADFSKPIEVAKVVEQISKENSYSILVNNTGGPPAGPIVNATQESFLQALEAHLFNNHLIAQALIPQMEANGYGRIVNIISTSVKAPLPNLGVSNTTRAAVAGWAKTLANEVAAKGITVNNVLPGATETIRLKNIISNKALKTNHAEEEISNEMIQEIPMRRFGKAEEIAAMIAFLCTPAAAYITGQSICVDGGRTPNLA